MDRVDLPLILAARLVVILETSSTSLLTLILIALPRLLSCLATAMAQARGRTGTTVPAMGIAAGSSNAALTTTTVMAASTRTSITQLPSRSKRVLLIII